MKIKNIAVVSQVEIGFESGLNLLTGETGAGKSILVDALSLLCGGRASAEMIRTGEAQASIEGVVESRGLAAMLERQGLPADSDEMILRREISATGKGRASVNGALVPVSLLREVALPVIEIHGQHDQRGLLDSQQHLEIVDALAGAATLARAREVAQAFGTLGRVRAELEALRRDAREQVRRREMLEFQAREIEVASLAPDEEEALRAEKAVQANAEKLLALSEECYSLLYEDDAAVLAQLRQVFKRLGELESIDPRFRPHLEARDSIVPALEDLALALRDYREKVHAAPGRLDAIESRLALIDRLKRKYGATLHEVIAFGDRCRAELQALGSPEERASALEQELAIAEEKYLGPASALSGARRQAAEDLSQRVEAELRHLAMEKARFRVGFEPPAARPGDRATWTERGLESAEFLLSPNPGEELRPLAKIASGGELSRVLLALESVASRGGAARTLVFDEVDVGIGGRVADVVGRKLRELAERHQVLCVTHLPQIAAQADRHHAVRKRVERGRTLTEVVPLGDEARVEEIARMLAGETVTEAARENARQLLKHSLRI